MLLFLERLTAVLAADRGVCKSECYPPVTRHMQPMSAASSVGSAEALLHILRNFHLKAESALCSTQTYISSDHAPTPGAGTGQQTPAHLELEQDCHNRC